MNNNKFANNNLASLIILAVLWGPTAMLMKIAVTEIHPITFIAATSLFSATSLVFFLIKIKHGELNFKVENLSHIFIVGALTYSIPSIMQCYAVQNIPSICIGIVVAIVPIIIACFAHYYIPNEKVTPKHIVGLAFGLLGFITLLCSSANNVEFNKEFFSLILVLLSVFCSASGLIYAKKHQKHLSSKTSPILHFLTSSIYLIPLAFLTDPNITNTFSSIPKIAYILIFSIPCTAMAYTYYYKLVKNSSTTFIAMVNYLLPIIKTLLGVIFLHEMLNLPLFIALILIFIGLSIVNSTEKHIPKHTV